MYNLKTYKNGLRLIHNYDTSSKAVSVNFFVMAGGKDEDDTNRGIAHLAEHMFFKGTEKRTSKDIIFEMDRLGLQNNAYTSQDLTCFYAEGLNDNVDAIFDILADCFFNSNYPLEELANEKKIVCSELEMYLDDNRDLIVQKGAVLGMQGTPYAYVLGGTVESVSKIEQADLLKYKKAFYTPNRLIISVSGDVSQDKIEALVEKYVLPLCGDIEQEPLYFELPTQEIARDERYLFTSKDTDQYYCFISFKSFYKSNKDEYAKYVTMLQALGGTLSSRLYQKVREEKGLVYIIQSVYSQYNMGNNGILFICNTNNAEETFKAIREVIDDLRNKGFTQDELTISQNLLKTNYALSAITPSSKAQKAAHAIMYNREIYDIEKSLERVSKVTVDDMNSMFKKYFDNKDLAVAVVAKEDNIKPLKILTE
ncbi:MAG: insulinase family protein [Clostridia bacterium]|nr:insulinase family protein [Clostridia bacterium]